MASRRRRVGRSGEEGRRELHSEHAVRGRVKPQLDEEPRCQRPLEGVIPWPWTMTGSNMREDEIGQIKLMGMFEEDEGIERGEGGAAPEEEEDDDEVRPKENFHRDLEEEIGIFSQSETGKGTEAFPDLGEHCNHDDCNQLDFLPFTCDGCHKVFCLEHRTYRDHGCPNSEHNSRMIVLCEICSVSIEKKADEQDRVILDRHLKSGDCDPTKKKTKNKCPVRRCKELLTFSNTSTCKNCGIGVCLKHRFPSDHGCKLKSFKHQHPLLSSIARKETNCRNTKQKMPTSPPTIEAC
ncbi:zinc finger AN1 and C2H2 domain-containing stress-associated protein 11 [Asparagus officinalis]|uniref:zinc finger AN1 and C2H2 domain-containing stress-associated protein 11 n=1 Tax=Asparagus officinalis TaxID=4686 RepID=UPI00098E2674|nr:zinc finger AN1 and C2H2 domain-containing stress-associated protein 11 [Asparagus officinalis]